MAKALPPKKVCFIADRHTLYDDRIYWKMAISLQKKSFQIYYILLGDTNESGVTAEGVDYTIFKRVRFSGNVYLNFILKKIFFTNNYKRLLKKAAAIKADVYHFHDLRINKIGKQLKRLPQRPVVIYDAREPYAADIRSYMKGKKIISPFRNIYAMIIDKWEKRKVKYYDLVITNEEILRDAFRKIFGDSKAEVIYNFTDNYKEYKDIPFEDKTYDFIYSGTITTLRGAKKVLEAAVIAQKRFPHLRGLFVGSYFPGRLKEEMQHYIDVNGLSDHITLMDKVNYKEIHQLYNLSRVGFVTLFPVETFKISMPIKIFEYSTFGLPMIGSDFGHMKKYIEKDGSGLTVDPLDAREMADALVKLLTDKEFYQNCSKNARAVALQEYRWDIEEERLYGFYDHLLEKRRKLERNQ